MAALRCCLGAFALLIGLSSVPVIATPLDDYVNAPDPTFAWTHISTISGNYGYTAYVLNMTSQTWMDHKNSSWPVWWHYIVVCVPDKIDWNIANTSFMYIDGGEMTDKPPTTVFQFISYFCLQSGTVTAHLMQIPNEPIVFADGKRRIEDAIIAYTWSHFINETNAPIWLLRLPMTKAAVRAMDAIQQFTASLNNGLKITQFVVAGASKRGWTTWTTGIVDKRVVAIAPIVMPILNMVPNMNHHFQCYDGWSFALSDYLDMHLMQYLNDPVFLEMAAIIDPYSYLDRLTMPKFLVMATGDEFFVPDSTQFFLNKLPNETHLFLAPNAEHSCATSIFDIIDTLHTWFHMLAYNIPRPKYSYELIKSNTTASIILRTDTAPNQVMMWWARTLPGDKLRDFRLIVCDKLPYCIQPVLWEPVILSRTNTTGVYEYIASMEPPVTGGWHGFLIEAYWNQAATNDFRVTTELNVVPDILPFPPCGDNCEPTVAEKDVNVAAEAAKPL